MIEKCVRMMPKAVLIDLLQIIHVPLTVRCVPAGNAPVVVCAFVYTLVVSLMMLMLIRHSTRGLSITSVDKTTVPVGLVRTFTTR